jgi:hypothetical protein
LTTVEVVNGHHVPLCSIAIAGWGVLPSRIDVSPVPNRDNANDALILVELIGEDEIVVAREIG